MSKLAKIMIAVVTVSTAVSFALVSVAEDTGLEKSLNAGLSMTDGNSETLDLTVGVDAERKWDANEFLAGAAFSYGETDSDRTKEDVKADAQYNRLVNETCYYYGQASFLYDDIASVDHRVIVGPGLGHYFIKDDVASLAVEAGGAYYDEEVAEVSDDGWLLRLAERYERDLSETAKVWQSVEYLPEFEDFDNYLLNFEIGLESAMNDSVSLRVVFGDRYDAIPAPGAEKNDITLTAGLGISL